MAQLPLPVSVRSPWHYRLIHGKQLITMGEEGADGAAEDGRCTGSRTPYVQSDGQPMTGRARLGSPWLGLAPYDGAAAATALSYESSAPPSMPRTASPHRVLLPSRGGRRAVIRRPQ